MIWILTAEPNRSGPEYQKEKILLHYLGVYKCSMGFY